MISQAAGFRQDLLTLPTQKLFLNKLFCHFRLCAVASTLFWIFFTNPHCAVLFSCVRVYSNTQNAFSIEVKDISIIAKI